MIIRKDGSFETSSLYPNTNWYEGEDNYIIDETTEEGQIMAETYIESYPLVSFNVNDNNIVTSVTPIDMERPPDIEGKSIELIKNEYNNWKYVYIDKPKTEVEIQQEIINTLGKELTDIKLQLLLGGI